MNSTPTVTMAWDSVYPRIDTMTDGTGKTNFSYVAAGKNGGLQLAGETGPGGATAQYLYGYDALGRIDQLTVAGVSQDTTTYDAIGRDTGNATPLGQIGTAYLGETDQVASITNLAQSISGSVGLTTYNYLPNNGDRRLSGITYNAAASSDEALTTDDADRVDTRVDGTGGTGTTEAYSYDPADRLLQSAVTASSGNYNEAYGYNNADFIKTKAGEPNATNNWTASLTGTVNQIAMLTPAGSTGHNYSYDANGNVLSDGIRHYTWDAENRLLTITEIASGNVSTFTYDGLGRRVAITKNIGGGSVKTGYLWCGATICVAYNNTGITARYQPEGEIRYTGGTATQYYYERDHLGTVTSMTSATGTALGTLKTDAYGLTLAQTGTAPTFAYAGMFTHQPTTTIPPLYLTAYRAYDPYSGRWLSRDLFGETGGLDLFSYADQNPVDKIDPQGAQAIPGAIIGAIAAGDAEYADESSACAPINPGAILGASAVGALLGAIGAEGAVMMGSTTEDAMVGMGVAGYGAGGLSGGCNPPPPQPPLPQPPPPAPPPPPPPSNPFCGHA